MKFNIHGPIYKNIEKEVLSLSYNITFDDRQLQVYSPRIAEIVLRAATEIESLAVELYYDAGGKAKNLSYKKAIDELEKYYKLKESAILVSFDNGYFSPQNSIIRPFDNWKKGESQDKTGHKILGGWDYAYQTIKHDKENNKYIAIQNYGTIRYAIWILSALFYLNFIYSGSVKLAIVSDIFKIIQKNNNGKYGVWDKSFPTHYKDLDDTFSAILDAQK